MADADPVVQAMLERGSAWTEHDVFQAHAFEPDFALTPCDMMPLEVEPGDLVEEVMGYETMRGGQRVRVCYWRKVRPLEIIGDGACEASGVQDWHVEPEATARRARRAAIRGDDSAAPGGPDDFVRASGDCICEQCGKEYRKHPFTNDRSWNGEPFLHQLCDGRKVKL